MQSSGWFNRMNSKKQDYNRLKTCNPMDDTIKPAKRESTFEDQIAYVREKELKQREKHLFENKQISKFEAKRFLNASEVNDDHEQEHSIRATARSEESANSKVKEIIEHNKESKKDDMNIKVGFFSKISEKIENKISANTVNSYKKDLIKNENNPGSIMSNNTFNNTFFSEKENNLNIH